MRHRKRGRRLGRSSSHRKAMMRNLASSLILTERDAEFDPNPPAVKGRVVTTLHKAKEVRSLVEKCVTIARRSLEHSDNAAQFETGAERGSEEWKQWRQSEQWQQWNQAIAPTLAARRRALQLLGDNEAVRVLFDEIAPRFADRPGGYTRVLRLPSFRLGDAGQKAILEFVGQHDRVNESSERPSFDEEEDDDAVDETISAEDDADDESAVDSTDETTAAEGSADGDDADDQDEGEAKSEE